MEINSNEANYINYLKHKYPKEHFVSGRTIHGEEKLEDAPLGSKMRLLYFGKKAIYFTLLDPLNLAYLSTDVWNYQKENILAILFKKKLTLFEIKVLFIEEKELYTRELFCRRFTFFNRFSLANFLMFLQGKKSAFIFKASFFERYILEYSQKNTLPFPPVELGLQVTYDF
ncbi:hypothetical protein [Vagococcus sp.]|uniref:hypothetical protein n=1 Tax=Vagococcus sp. TaxID=1933889 RepID=UPI003F944A8C